MVGLKLDICRRMATVRETEASLRCRMCMLAGLALFIAGLAKLQLRMVPEETSSCCDGEAIGSCGGGKQGVRRLATNSNTYVLLTPRICCLPGHIIQLRGQCPVINLIDSRTEADPKTQANLLAATPKL